MHDVIEQTVIVGNGTAAVECFKKMRQCGYPGKIDVFAAGDKPPCNPMLTSYYVSEKISYEKMFPYGHDFSVFENNNITFHKNTPIVKVDETNHLLVSKTNEEYAFDKCLIATGANAFLPNFKGHDNPGVYTLRTPEDAVRLKEGLKAGPKKAVVVGASMVGIKIVELFVNAGVECCLTDMASHIFPLSANEECANYIESRLISKGVSLQFAKTLESVEEINDGLRVRFENSDEFEDADMVIICIGVRANIDMIDKSRIKTDQGILVNERMETTAPNIYAAGDVAQGYNLLTGQNQIIGLWANARYQGRTAGANMAGVKEEYRGELPHNISHFMGMDFVSIGEVADYEESKKEFDDLQYREIFYRDGEVCGANLVNSFEDCGIIKYAIAKADSSNKPTCIYNKSFFL